MSGPRRVQRAAPPLQQLPLRERKKLRTQKAIQEQALRLFTTQGFAATTVEDIAAAAEVSPSTFYRYFPTKEAVAFWDQWDLAIVDALLARPAEEEPIDSLRKALVDLLPEALRHEEDLIRRRVALIRSEPGLRAHQAEETERGAAMLCDAFARRAGASAPDLRTQVAVSAFLAAVMVAMSAWADDGGDLRELVAEAVDVLDRGCRVGANLSL